MSETLFGELKRYVGFGEAQGDALRALHPVAQPHFRAYAETFYQRILEHDGARTSLVGGESSVGHLKVTLQAWMEQLLSGPWDEAYFERRCRIGRMHVRIALPQHYMFGAMNGLRQSFTQLIDQHYDGDRPARQRARTAVDMILDLELAIMLHTYQEDSIAFRQTELAQRARTAEKLAAVGTMTAGLSHEIRNPLNAASLQLMVLQRRIDKLPDELKPPLNEPLGLVRDEIRRLDHLLEDFLQLARPREVPMQPVDVAALVAAVLDLLQGDADKRGVQLVRDLQPTDAVMGDDGRLRQVVMNLALNALDASPGGGAVTVHTQRGDGVVVLTVDDTGAGVPVDSRERIFEPFFTTKAQGTGLGLSIVHGIVSHHGGTISVDTAPTGGARFVVRLPLNRGA